MNTLFNTFCLTRFEKLNIFEYIFNTVCFKMSSQVLKYSKVLFKNITKGTIQYCVYEFTHK